MSRRASSSERKRRLSIGGEQTDKRPRSDNARAGAVHGSSHDRGNASAGPSNPSSSASSAASYPVKPERPVEHSSRRHQESSSPTMSSPESSSSHRDDHDSRTARGSVPPRHPEASGSVRTRPTWQTEGPSDQHRDSHWQREHRDPRDHREQRESMRPSSANPSRAITPTGGFSSSSNAIVQPPIKTQAAFVGKLYSMLEDEKIAKSGLLYWSGDGSSFVCPNPTEFSKEVLPNYFKHNNWQSFVRQLNMYSFNKVSDLYSTANSDPQAWEFRHPLFRRGEPHLLPSIKRKSTRPSNQDGPANDEDARPPNWQQQPPVQPQYRGSPGRDYPNHPNYYPAPPPPPPVGRPDSRHHYDAPRSPPPPPHTIAHDPSHPPAGPIYQDNSRSEPPYYPHPPPSRPSPVESLGASVASLQDQVQSLWGQLHAERQSNMQINLEMAHSMLRMTDWLTDASKDLRLPYDHLMHQRSDLISRIEAINASDRARTYASGPPHDDRRGMSYEPPNRSIHSAMHDPRQVYTSHHQPSPPQSRMPDRVRPSTSDTTAMSGYSGSPRTYPSSRQPPPTSDFRFRPPPLDDRLPPRERERERDRDRDRERPRPLSRRETDPLPPHTPDDRPSSSMDINAPKTSIRNLLH